ncbi:MAG TPA: choice-of-anchor tandem repeat GloVer-containing protein [Candidatus Eisenbacteria bacterium]|nr:choice-of-anchor tandem repeat GloVer-containing protein [Candidatus Eisenbacteria bacterium]
MRSSSMLLLLLAILVFGLVFASPAVAGVTGNCPPEPVANTPIGSGQIYIGSNCSVYTPGDVDSFVFNGTSGQTVHIAMAINGAGPTNICLSLYNPSFVKIYNGCTNIPFVFSVITDQMLTATGTYTMTITEPASGTVNYAVSLERLYPFPPNAQKVPLQSVFPGNIAALTDTNPFTFDNATTGVYRTSATLPGNASQNLCMTLYAPDGTVVSQNVCTNIPFVFTIQIDYTPTQNGTSMVFFSVAGNHGTATYNMEISCLLGICPVTTPSLNTLHHFGSNDGAHPAGLIQAHDGNLYGTTADGAGLSAGSVFKITTAGALTTLYNFCSQLGCADGVSPQAGVIQASDGDFYGTTYTGGANNYGTVFKITSAGALTTLYSFNSTDGANPVAGLVEGNDGDFYGTTYWGGTKNRGTVFKITPAGALTTLYSFCTRSGCSDGFFPRAGLIQASDGNFYGTTDGGGSYHRGTIFMITPIGTLTTLHSFNLRDGANPDAGLIQATDGNLYGTTSSGGSHEWGTVFKITLGGMLTTLYNFGAADGANPESGLIQATDGNFYGTTYGGGAHLRGAIFQITSAGALKTLYSFSLTDGSNPTAGLVQDMSGSMVFYGTTNTGGSHNFGTVFSLSTGP